MDLFDATLDLARRIGLVRDGVATATTTSSLADSAQAYANGEYESGTIWLQTTRLFLRILTSGSETFTFATQAGAPANGQRYAVTGRDFPLDQLISGINSALRDLYQTPLEDNTLATVANQGVYTLPTGVSNLLSVEVPAGVVGSETKYVVSQHWKELNGKLRFDPGFEPAETGDLLRLLYRRRAVDLTTGGDMIPADVDPELLIWKAAIHVLRWGYQMYGTDSQRRIVDRMNEAQEEVARRAGNKRLSHKVTHIGAW